MKYIHLMVVCYGQINLKIFLAILYKNRTVYMFFYLDMLSDSQINSAYVFYKENVRKIFSFLCEEYCLFQKEILNGILENLISLQKKELSKILYSSPKY